MLCLVQNNDNLTNYSLRLVFGSALKSYCKCLACVSPNFLKIYIILFKSEDAVNKFEIDCIWIWGVTVALFTFLNKDSIKNTHGIKNKHLFLTRLCI